MISRRFELVPFGGTAPEGAIACDGLVDGAAVHLSHWAGNRTPDAFRRDTSTESALVFARERGDDRALPVAANNHFDTDGLLSVFALCEPERALRHESLLVAAAEAGDFDEWPADDAGLALDLAVGAISARAIGDRATYRVALEVIGDVVERLDAHRDLWERPFSSLVDALERARRSEVRVLVHGGIVAFVHAPGVSEAPGPVLTRLAPAGAARWLVALERDDGRFDYRYERPRYAWADTVVRPPIPPPSRNAIVRDLGPGWAIKGAGLGMTGLLQSIDPMPIAPETLIEKIAAADPGARSTLAPACAS